MVIICWYETEENIINLAALDLGPLLRMATPIKAAKDMRIRNVSLHSRGKTEHGTLYLTQYHLIFSYIPDAEPEKSVLKKATRASSDSHVLAPEAENASLPKSVAAAIESAKTFNPEPGSSSLSAPGNQSTSATAPGTSTASATSHPRPRPKEIWVPYPVINHCSLRSSLFSNQISPTKPPDGAELPRDSLEDGLFPPVYGTTLQTRSSLDSGQSTSRLSAQKVGQVSSSTPAGHLRDTARAPALRIRRRDFQMMAFHFHAASATQSPDSLARDVFYCLRERCCIEDIQDIHAFHFKAPQEEIAIGAVPFDARREFARMGICEKAKEGPGTAWRLTEINKDYQYAPTYPSVLCVPRSVSDNLLKYGGVFRSKARIPALTYLHGNGGSITRSSQPMVGLQNRRNPQDERLVSAIFSSHTPPLHSPEDSPKQLPDTSLASPATSGMTVPEQKTTEQDVLKLSLSPEPSQDDPENNSVQTVRTKIYGSTRRNLIVDARPRINAIANRASGGGIEDVSNYVGSSGVPVEKVFLNVANIHVMRQSLDKVIESFANSDYLDMRPNQELLRKSGWLEHISNMLDGAEMVARVVGLGGSHALVHCSDGWDRTAQVSALAEIMLDPYYRSLTGFVTLVQKDFLSFGHKFNHRNGIQGSEKWFEIENERVMPTRSREGNGSEANTLNTFGSKALSGAKNWFEKNRGNLFRQPGTDPPVVDNVDSRPPSPPTQAGSVKDEKENKVDVKEIAPIFHQFLDGVFQLQTHHPNAFEFNERFLRRLLYQTYSGQYGEFLFNCEKDRTKYMDRTPSVWPHFLSRRKEFTNPDYQANPIDALLFPRRRAPGGDLDVRWWSSLFGRKDEDMNTPRSLAPLDPETAYSSLSAEPSTRPLKNDFTLFHTSTGSAIDRAGGPADAVGGLSPKLNPQSAPRSDNAAWEPNKNANSRPTIEHQITDPDALARYAGEPLSQESLSEAQPSEALSSAKDDEHDDPLGAMAENTASRRSETKLDFADFARQNAFSERR